MRGSEQRLQNRVWINKPNSFAEAERFDREYYKKMKPSERIEIVQFLREQYFKLKGEGRERLRRSVKVVQQA
jgi:hypothetical protein